MCPRNLVVVAVILGCLAGCKSPPRFHHTALISSQYDADNAATRVAVRFEVRDAEGLPVGDLTAENLTIREDGVLATSESHVRLEQTRHPIRVALLLDRSDSVRNGEALANIKTAAQGVIDGLAGHPCEVRIYTFANTIEQLPSLNQLATSARGNTKSRWTALYHAINTVLNESAFGQPTIQQPAARPEGELGVTVQPTPPENPPTILVICTDGADNYSQNFSAPSLADLEKFIAANKVIVHTLGFGNVEQEQDRQGIDGAKALRRLAVHGSFHDATEPEAIHNITRHIIRRIPATYTCVFYSPSLSGEHELTLEIDCDGSKGHSAPIRFTAGKTE